MSDISTWPAGTYTLDANGFYYILGVQYFWFSDFDGQIAVSGTFVVTDNGDGTGTIELALYY